MSNTSKLPIDSIETDSFKLRILLEKVEVLDASVKGKWVLLHTETGEVDSKQFKENCISVNTNGIKTKYSIGKQKLVRGELPQEYLVININSKLLKERYLEGITKDNIRLVYAELMSHKVVKFSYEDFISAELTDVDFKRDAIVKGFSDVVKTLMNMARQSNKKGEGALSYNKSHNLGIEFSDRETTSYINNPFLKLYHKGIHLKKSNDQDTRRFYDEYLFNAVDDSLIDDRVRAEYTVKNKKHFRYYGIEQTTLKNILSLSQEVKLHMLHDIANKHLLPQPVRARVHKEDLTPNDSIIIEMLDAVLQLGMAFSMALDKAVSGIVDKSQKSKKRKQITKLYESFLKGTEYDVQAENTLHFVQWLRGA